MISLKHLYIKQLVWILTMVSWLYGYSATKIAKASGYWNSSATWAPAGEPEEGDDVIISGNFIVRLISNLDSEVSSITISGNGTLDANQFSIFTDASILIQQNAVIRNVNHIATPISIQNFGTLKISGNLSVSGSMVNESDSLVIGGNITAGAFVNKGLAKINGNIQFQSSSISGVIFSNTGTLDVGGNFIESSNRFPAPAGTNNFFPTMINSGVIQFANGILRMDGYLVNSGFIYSASEIRVRGVFCNNTFVETEQLTVRGGFINCTGNWIVPSIVFDLATAQIGTPKRGVLNAGNFCSALVNGEKPELIDLETDGIITSVSYCANALPVAMIDFAGKNIGDDIELTWSTSLEQGNSGFIVEHSITGEQFSSIGWIKGNGTSNQISTYRFVHQNPSFGNHYYRLIQVDHNGNYSTTKIISVLSTGASLVSAWPNPSSGKLSIQITNAEEVQEVYILNASGQVVFRMIPTSQEAANSVLLELETNLPNGVYTVLVNTQNNSYSLPWVVIN